MITFNSKKQEVLFICQRCKLFQLDNNPYFQIHKYDNNSVVISTFDKSTTHLKDYEQLKLPLKKNKITGHTKCTSDAIGGHIKGKLKRCNRINTI